MPLHLAGILGLIIIFVVGTTRSINLGALSLALTFLVGTVLVGETPREMASGFPVDLFVLLTGVTYLFGVATKNGTVERIVDRAVGLARGRRSLVPWVVFAVAAFPAMAGAIGSAGVALLAPLAMRLAERCNLDRRMMGLMVVHGAASGNFSPLNVLAAIIRQAMSDRGLEMSAGLLFGANLFYNVALGFIIVAWFGGFRRTPDPRAPESSDGEALSSNGRFSPDQLWTVAAIAGVAIVSLGFGVNIGFSALTAGVLLQAIFPAQTQGAERHIAWSVVLLVCGIVTYVSALQRFGTIDAVGIGIAGLGTPLLVAFLLCTVAAVTSAVASSAGILGAIIPLAAPFMIQGGIGASGMAVALALSATVVDATPFSTVGALVVANASEDERQHVYRGLLIWGFIMVITAPVITWLLFVLPSA